MHFALNRTINLTLPLIIPLTLCVFLPESAKWLMVRRRDVCFVCICRYVTSAERRSTVTEAAYSQLDVVGGPRSRRRRSVFCGCFTITVAFVSILLNIAMSATALIVIVRVTSPGSDVFCFLLQSLRTCPTDSNCTSPTGSVSQSCALRDDHTQTVRR